MRILLSLIVCIVLSSCTRIAFTESIGNPISIPAKDDILGDWTGDKGIVWHIKRIQNSNAYIAEHSEDGKDQNIKFILTKIAGDTVILWAEDKELSAYLPFRVASGITDSFTLLYPDEEALKRLVSERKVVAVHDNDKKSWIVSKGDWEPLLKSKDFWSIDFCMPFTKIKKKANKTVHRTIHRAALSGESKLK